MQFVFVTKDSITEGEMGTVVGALGASLKARDFNVNYISLDMRMRFPVNNPVSYADVKEVFVTADGQCGGVELGCVERYTPIQMGKPNMITAGSCNKLNMLTAEAIKKQLMDFKDNHKKDYSLTIVMVIGMVGDSELLPVWHALMKMRNLRYTLLHLSYYTNKIHKFERCIANHLLTLRLHELQPSLLFCVSPHQEESKIFSSEEVGYISHHFLQRDLEKLPQRLDKQTDLLLKNFGYENYKKNYGRWEMLEMENSVLPKPTVCIGLVMGDYEATGSVAAMVEALEIAAIKVGVYLEISFAHPKNYVHAMQTGNCDGLIICPIYKYKMYGHVMTFMSECLRLNIPCFAVGEGANLVNTHFIMKYDDLPLKQAVEDAVQFSPSVMGNARVVPDKWTGTNTYAAYGCNSGKDVFVERFHADRFPMSDMEDDWKKHNYVATAKLQKYNQQVVTLELPCAGGDSHPFFMGCNFLPHYNTTYFRPHPLLVQFLEAAKKKEHSRFVSKKVSGSTVYTNSHGSVTVTTTK